MDRVNKDSRKNSLHVNWIMKKIIFDEIINSTEPIFLGLDNIDEIYLLLFDFSHITTKGIYEKKLL